MKKVLFTLMCLTAMMAAGTGLKAQEITITLEPGWNWISYPNAEVMDVASALGDFVPMAGDIIRSRLSSSTYINGQWRGSVTQFTPGLGYMYYSSRTESVNFAFSIPSAQSGALTMTTSEPVGITATTVMLGGSVFSNDGTAILMKGVCWATHPRPTTYDTYSENGSASSTFTVELSGLTPNTVYYVRAYVASVKGVNYGEEVSFTTLPVISTDSVTDILGNGATCWGTVGIDVIERGICWSKYNDNPTLNDYHLNDYHLIDTIGMDNVFSITITNDLRPNTTYYVRAYAITVQSIYYGDVLSFTTKSGIPVVSTADVIDITANSATCGGTVTDDGGSYVFERGICWSTSHNPTTIGSHASCGTGTGSFSSILTGLTPNTTYYVRAYAITAEATTYSGEEIIFTTSLPSYTVTVSSNSTAGGTVSGGGTYNYGDICTLTATPATGYIFYHWKKGTQVVSTNASYSFVVTESASYVAQFQQQSQPQNYTISVSANPSNGTVSGSGTYDYGQTCTLTATPNSGYTFINWTENGIVVSTSASYTFTVNSNRTLVANFSLKSYTISASASPTAGGSVSGAGTYNHGSTCTLTATANTGYTFTKWTKNGTQVSTSASYSFTVTGNGTYVANFSQSTNVPTGAINGQFTINSSGSKVYFSQGNLQYIGSASTPYWKFADHQWDCLGDNGQGSTSTTVDRDLFGWGTSGYNHNNACYQPWSTNTSYSKYFAYGNYTYNLYDGTGKADWGYNKISNGGNTANSGWRTLTTEEWKYVLYTRNPSGPRFAKAKVNGVNGLILLPDDWNTSWYTLNYMNSRAANFSVNIINFTQWQTLEQHGAVFLPAAGYRYGTSGSYVDSYGYYWSASYDCNSDACKIDFSNTSLSWTDYGNRCYGHSVRLVRPTQTTSSTSYNISASAMPNDGGTVFGSGIYDIDVTCTLTAIPNEGYIFSNWTENGSVVSTNANYTFTVTANRNLVANFDHAYVDLGLPSGLLWATCNVGADNPEDYGDYFAWGETTTKSTYNWITYQYCNGSYNTLTKYCNDSSLGYNGFTDGLTILLPEDDAATTNWGSSWRMPTPEEWQELYSNTTITWTTQNGVNGRLFTASNGNNLFLPAVGCRSNSSLYDAGSEGHYWSSSLDSDDPNGAWYFYLGSYNPLGPDPISYRCYGHSVRAVRSGQN